MSAEAAAPCDLLLRDGSTIRVREVEPGDAAEFEHFLEALSTESRRLRFFTAGPDLHGAARWAATIAERDGLGLVATLGDPPRIVAHGGFERSGADSAEIAFEVAEGFRGRGLATGLMAQLATRARERGILVFAADVLAENRRMLDVFAESGFPMAVVRQWAQLRVELTTSLTAESLERSEQRERAAAAAAIRHFLAPGSVAVIGASRRSDSVGGATLRNLRRSTSGCRIYPVNPHARSIQGLECFASVGALPEIPELAVVITPAERVAEVARECALKQVPALLVLSAGFAEAGADGVRREEELMAICRAAGMRLVGPNCLGVFAGEGRVNATFAPHPPPEGAVGLLSQSGGVGLALIERATALGLGLSSFVSIGNRPDVSANDVLEYWEEDPTTEVGLLYLESFGNPRNFARIARRLAAQKPVLAVHAGRSAAGARAAASHTGAAISASGAGAEALFHHAGVVQARTLEELFDAGALAASQPLPAGRRVGIVTNAGGPAILCADACQANDVELPELSPRLREELARHLPALASTANPVDMLAAAGPAEFDAVIDLLAASGEVDAVIAIFVPALGATASEVEARVGAAAGAAELPVLLVSFADRGPSGARERVPVYAYPEKAARALSLMARYVEWRQAPRGAWPSFDGIRRSEALELVGAAVSGGGRWLRPGEVVRLLRAWGVPLVESHLARGPAAAGRAAAELGGPVVLKAEGEGIVHKTELGAVELNLAGQRDTALAARRMARRLRRAGRRPEGFVVQRQASGGIEMLAGLSRDPALGPLVACGAGGTAAELLGDVAVRLAPLTDTDASAMVRSLSAFPLLAGYRGSPTADVAALEEVLLRLGAMADFHPEIAELDCNPVLVDEHGATVLDARVRVELPGATPPWPSLGAPPPSELPRMPGD